jgi:hypothetical protein
MLLGLSIAAVSFLLGTLHSSVIGSNSASTPSDSSSLAKNPPLKESDNVKLIVYVPIPNGESGDPYTHVDKVRQALGDAGAGWIGGYRYCSFSTVGDSRFKTPTKANGVVDDGIKGFREVAVGVVVSKKELSKVIEAARKAHPWEVMGYDIHPLLELKEEHKNQA